MRKTIFNILMLCGLAGMLLGCSDMLDSPNHDGAATGTVLVQVGTEARTVGPTVGDFAEYRLTFEKGSTVIAEVMTPAEDGKAFDLEPGTWTLNVMAFIEVGGEKRPSVSGTVTLTVAAGKTIQTRVTLSEYEPDTYGTFDYSAIDYSAIEEETLKTASMTITPSNPNQGTVVIDLLKENNSGTLELPVGIYTVLVELTSGRSIVIGNFDYGLNAYRQETVYIYPYMTTALRAGEYEFTETDFIADLYFTGTAEIASDSSGADTYKPTKVHIIKAVDNDGYVIGDYVGFDQRVIDEALIDEDGNWELYLPANEIADNIKAPFTSTDGIYNGLGGYPVFFCFTMQSQQNPENTMQSRWVWQEIVNKHGKRDIALEAKIRKITVPTWGIVEGNSAVKNAAGYDVVYADDSNNQIILTVHTANSGIMSDTVQVKKKLGNIEVGDLTPEDDALDVISDPNSVFITFKMPDIDVDVTARFFVPEGNILVHAADNSTGSYTARQVFVWLDADNDYYPDTDDPIDVGNVDGNTWGFTLPAEHQAYSGDFLFQFRLTRTSKSDILSRKFRVNVSQLAGDAENKISLAIEIRTLTVADMAGKGTITITASEMRTAEGYLTDLTPLASGDYAAEGTVVWATVSPIGDNYPLGLSYTPIGGLTNSAYPVSTGGNSKTYGFTMPSANTTLTAQFFVPEGNVLVHAADESTGGYTAQQVFVWLDANDDYYPDTDNPISIGSVTGNTSWKFTLPTGYQAYSGDFLFQFRLTKVDKPDILSRKFKVNALQLAGDAENKISLAIEIRTLTVADTEGKGDITITASEMRTAYGSNSTPLPILVSGDYAAEGTTIRATVAPTEGYYPSGLSYTPAGGSPNSAGYVSASGNSRTYGFTMPSANTTLTAQFTEVPPISNIAYSAALGDAWVLQGDERRQSPTITDGGVTKARISFTSDVSNASITIQLDVSSELGYDYAFISELDNADATYQSGFTAGSVISGANSVTITIPIPTTGNHFIDIGYRKDGSNDVGSDCAWFKIIQ